MFLTGTDLESLASADVPYVASEVEWRASRRNWYTVLLHQTLEYASSEIRHYRNSFSSLRGATSFTRLSDLALFPVVTKSDLAADLRAFMCSSPDVTRLFSTSGTTARMLNLYGNSDEERARDALCRVRFSEGQVDAVSIRIVPGPRRLVSTYSSTAATMVIGYTLNQSYHQWFDYTDYLARVLNDEYLFGNLEQRVKFIHVTPPWMLEFITRQLQARSIDPKEFGIEAIAVSGGFVTTRTRSTIVDEWNAEYLSTYSCGEIRFGEARDDASRPGCYRLGPTMYAEILDPDCYRPVGPGEAGTMVLTSLYPFQQVMPLIRYDTGDLVQRVEEIGWDGLPPIDRFVVIGRKQHCVRISDRHFVGPGDVLSAVADVPEVPQFPYPRFHLEVRERPVVTVHLKIEIVEASPARQVAISERIAAVLKKIVANRDPALSGLEATCQLLTKGELSDYCRLYPDR